MFGIAARDPAGMVGRAGLGPPCTYWPMPSHRAATCGGLRSANPPYEFFTASRGTAQWGQVNSIAHFSRLTAMHTKPKTKSAAPPASEPVNP